MGSRPMKRKRKMHRMITKYICSVNKRYLFSACINLQKHDNIGLLDETRRGALVLQKKSAARKRKIESLGDCNFCTVES